MIKKVLMAIVLIFLAALNSQAAAQGVGKLYLITDAEQAPEQTIWEVNQTARRLLTIETVQRETPRQAFSEHELAMMADSGEFFADQMDTPWIGQHIEAFAALDDHRFVLVTAHSISSIADHFFGYYDVQLLDGQTGDLTTLFTLDYHDRLMEDQWHCGRPDLWLIVDALVPNPTADAIALSVAANSYRSCGGGQTFIIPTAPAPVEIIPDAAIFSWSPDGSMMAYAGITCSAEDGCLTTYAVRAATSAESTIIARYRLPEGVPPLITWIDAQTVVYQYTDLDTMSDNAVWDGYDVRAGQPVFSEELSSGEFYALDYLTDGQAYLIYGKRGADLVLMDYAEGKLTETHVEPTRALFNSGSLAISGLTKDRTTIQVLTVDGQLSMIDLAPFVPADQTLWRVAAGRG